MWQYENCSPPVTKVKQHYEMSVLVWITIWELPYVRGYFAWN
jgi:hypothetical protein